MNRDYYAPEQRFAQATAVDHRADIYALGCILYELLTSLPPVRVNAPKIGALSSVLKPIEPVWERMIAWEPSDRYQHIDEALEDLSVAFGLVLATLHGIAGLEHPDVSRMSKLLRSNSPEHRQQGLELAIHLGKVALPALHSLIGHSKREVRNWCAKAMGGISDPASLRYLVAGLYNETPNARRTGFTPFVGTAAEVISRYPLDERLHALQLINQEIQIEALKTIVQGVKTSAAYDAVVVLRDKGHLKAGYDYSTTVLRLLGSIDEARAWPEIEKAARKDINSVDKFLPVLGMEHQKALLTEWASRGPDYGWRFKYLIEGVARTELDIETKRELFDTIERTMSSFKGEFNERQQMHLLLEKARIEIADGGVQSN
jgi:hypothetical protein